MSAGNNNCVCFGYHKSDETFIISNLAIGKNEAIAVIANPLERLDYVILASFKQEYTVLKIQSVARTTLTTMLYEVLIYGILNKAPIYETVYYYCI